MQRKKTPPVGVSSRREGSALARSITARFPQTVAFWQQSSDWEVDVLQAIRGGLRDEERAV